MIAVLFVIVAIVSVKNIVNAQACQAYSEQGQCTRGFECGTNWFSSVTGLVTGCQNDPSPNVRCCVPSCVGQTGLPGVCASSCNQISNRNLFSDGKCGSGLNCCTQNYPSIVLNEARSMQGKFAQAARLRANQVVALVAPASPVKISRGEADVWALKVLVGSWGVQYKIMPHAFDSSDGGRVAGTDEDRAADLMAAFRDQSVGAIIAFGGGYGCNRLVDLLDYDVIRANPKPLMGYSDLTACIQAIAWRGGLTALHGPMVQGDWDEDSGNFARRALMGDQPYTALDLKNVGTSITVTPGVRAGRLVGGNLAVFAGLIGAEWPLTPNANEEKLILVLEEVGEAPYRVERWLQQLGHAGLLNRINGFVFGTCVSCTDRWNWQSAVRKHTQHLGIPVVMGASFGHHGNQFVLPIGQEVILDADRREIVLLRPATAATVPSLPPATRNFLCAVTSPSTGEQMCPCNQNCNNNNPALLNDANEDKQCSNAMSFVFSIAIVVISASIALF